MWWTPNKMIPLNDREPGEIADVALLQLLPYQEVARNWPVYGDHDQGRYVSRCLECNQGLWFILDKEGNWYDYKPEEIQALLVAHIRQRHPERVTDGLPR